MRVIAMLLAGLILAACQETPDPGRSSGDPGTQAAAFDPQAPSEDVIMAFMRLRQLPSEQREQAESQVADLYLLSAEAARTGLLERRGVAAEIEVQRLNWIANRVLNDHARNNPISDEAVRAEYEAGVAATGTIEYRVRHVLVGDEQRARSLIEQLDGGMDFTALEQSLVGELGAPNAGELGWVNTAQVPEAFAKAMVTLAPGTYTAEPVASEYGWHVIRLEESRELAPPPFEEVQASIRNNLARRQVEAFLEQLRARNGNE